MLERLFSRLLPDWDRADTPEGRRRLGALAGWAGAGLNLLLFAAKLAAGLFTGAVSVTADAFNSLSDAASSLVTLAGFRLAGRRADLEHPFGHGRAEYLAGLIVALFILLVGLELGKSALERIFHPVDTILSFPAGLILALSALAKLALGRFHAILGKKARSPALRAAARDAGADALATASVLLGLALSRWSGFPLDGWLGLGVALFILRSGFLAVRDTLDPLLGAPPDPDEVAEIEALLLHSPGILGIHDLVIHDYGPDRRMMTVHAEVDAARSLTEAHRGVDQAERALREKFGLEAVIHMDPVPLNDPQIDTLRAQVGALAKALHPTLTVHDLQASETELSFDVVAPYEVPLSDGDIQDRLTAALLELRPGLSVRVGVDRSPVL